MRIADSMKKLTTVFDNETVLTTPTLKRFKKIVDLVKRFSASMCFLKAIYSYMKHLGNNNDGLKE